MSKVFTATAGALLGVATWFLLFVILGYALGTSFIALAVILCAGLIGAGLIWVGELGIAIDAPITSVGMLAGVGTFAVLEIVLSVTMWVGVIAGLSVIGLYDVIRAIGFATLRTTNARADVPVASEEIPGRAVITAVSSS
jgi:hypothetical protein